MNVVLTCLHNCHAFMNERRLHLMDNWALLQTLHVPLSRRMLFQTQKQRCTYTVRSNRPYYLCASVHMPDWILLRFFFFGGATVLSRFSPLFRRGWGNWAAPRYDQQKTLSHAAPTRNHSARHERAKRRGATLQKRANITFSTSSAVAARGQDRNGHSGVFSLELQYNSSAGSILM